MLTRLPPPARRIPAVVARLLATTFPQTRFLSARAAASLLTDLETALTTRDPRALEVYRALDVDVELLD